MPITLSAPPVTGSVLQGMFQGYDTASANARADQAAQISALLHGMRLRELQRRSDLESNVAPALAGLSALTPETYTPTGPAPAPVLPGGQPEALTPEGALTGAPGPGSLVPGLPTPASPVPTGPPVTGLTYSKIASALGPEQFKALLGTETGRMALKTSGAITDQEFQQRKRIADARMAFTEESQKAMEAYKDSDPLAGILAQAAALRHLAGVADEAHVAPLMSQVNQLMEFYIQAKKDPQELARMKRDAPSVAAAMKDYMKSHDPDVLIDAMSNVESQRFKKWADDTLHTLAQGIEMKNPIVAQFWQAYGDAGDAARRQGQAADPKELFRAAANAVPKAVGPLIQDSLTGRRPLPDAFQEVLFGKSYPKTVWEAAGRAVTDAGISVNDSRFGAIFMQKLSEAEHAAKPEKDTTVADLLNLLKSHETSLKDLIAEQRALPKATDRLIMPPTEQASVNERDRDLQTQITEAKELTRELRERVDRAVGAKHPKLAPPGTPQPIPPAAPSAPAPTPPVQATVPGPGAAAVPAPAPAVAPAVPRFGAGAPDAIALKGRRDALVVSMFPGKAWDELLPEQKQVVADAMNKPGP